MVVYSTSKRSESLEEEHMKESSREEVEEPKLGKECVDIEEVVVAK